jgi:hypothetical protein
LKDYNKHLEIDQDFLKSEMKYMADQLAKEKKSKRKLEDKSQALEIE